MINPKDRMPEISPQEPLFLDGSSLLQRISLYGRYLNVYHQGNRLRSKLVDFKAVPGRELKNVGTEKLLNLDFLEKIAGKYVYVIDVMAYTDPEQLVQAALNGCCRFPDPEDVVTNRHQRYRVTKTLCCVLFPLRKATAADGNATMLYFEALELLAEYPEVELEMVYYHVGERDNAETALNKAIFYLMRMAVSEWPWRYLQGTQPLFTLDSRPAFYVPLVDHAAEPH